MTVTRFDEMIGRVPVRIDGAVGDDLMTFVMSDGSVFRFLHRQDCCENVAIEEIVGDPTDLLLGAPLSEAEEVDSSGAPAQPGDGYTWTFYKFGSASGTLTVRWLGTSNGYYSESVEYEEELQPRFALIQTGIKVAKAAPEAAADLGETLDDLEKLVH